MDFEPKYKNGEVIVSETTFAAVMKNVYVWMTLGLALTGLTAYYVANSPVLLNLIFGSKLMFFGLIIGELALVFILSGMINKLSFMTAAIMFGAYAIINGATLSSIFLAYAQSTISTAFFVTAGTFAAMSLIGYNTKKDLSTMGKILYMALIGLIIAVVVNIFLKSSMMDFVVSIIGVIIFTGLTAYDTQKIKHMLFAATEADNEVVQKVALLGSLSLYLDFINLFLYILRLFGSRD